jgi:hypothetical protein
MARTCFGMTMSLDGFVADRNGDVSAPYPDPVLLGGGLRLFEGLGSESIQLERVAVLESGPWTELRFRVLRSA